jgi:ADP-ribose pyrophosphatase YjhB (NUDIX family)
MNYPNQPPDLGNLASFYQPMPVAARELNFNDEWRARWYAQSELPENAPVAHEYAVVFMRDKGYVTRSKGTTVWGSPEGVRGDETPEAFVRRVIKEQLGATAATVELLGFFECLATSHNPLFPKDFITVRPFYLVVAKKIDDLPRDSEFEKRRLPINEFMPALRGRYPELAAQVQAAGQRYAVLRANGKA